MVFFVFVVCEREKNGKIKMLIDYIVNSLGIFMSVCFAIRFQLINCGANAEPGGSQPFLVPLRRIHTHG